MTLIYPIKITIVAYETEDGRWSLNYSEWYKPEYKDTVESSFEDMAKVLKEQLPNLEIKHDKKECKVTMNNIGSKEMIFSMLTGEFLTNSPIGSLTLSEILVLSQLKSYLKKPSA